MPIRNRTRIKLGPGVRLNLGKKSAGVSFGGPGLRYRLEDTGQGRRGAAGDSRLIAKHDHTARLVGRTREAMEFSVTPQ
jgi:hypothetical protein